MIDNQAVKYGGPERARQASASILMVDPACFGFNSETAQSNRFSMQACFTDTALRARREFSTLVRRLEEAGVAVHTLTDTPVPAKPDAAFPNNWISFHADGTVVTYPMEAESRRHERRIGAVRALLGAAGFEIRRALDLSGHENNGIYLEGTGSLVLDRPRSRAYACLSSRTHQAAIADFDRRMGYSTLTFAARDPGGAPIYHTNVMMSLGTRYALLCLDTVAPEDRGRLIEDLEGSGRTLIVVDYDQLRSFACNIIELEDGKGGRLVAMSSGAHASLRPAQRDALERLAGPIVHAPIPTIEAVAGGGVRCMIADIHLPRAG